MPFLACYLFQMLNSHKMIRFFAFFFLIAFVVGCSSKEQKESVRVFAASSLAAPLVELKALFERQTGTSVKLNFASSGLLAQQIAKGVPADLFLSANQKWASFLSSKNQNWQVQDRALVTNELVFACRDSTQQKVWNVGEEYPFSKTKLAMGDPATVPLGQYGKKMLKEMNWWKISQKNLLFTKDAASALKLLKEGHVECALVYQSQVKQEASLYAIGAVEQRLQPKVGYFLQNLSGKRIAEELQAFLNSSEAQKVFADFGFSRPIPDEL